MYCPLISRPHLGLEKASMWCDTVQQLLSPWTVREDLWQEFPKNLIWNTTELDFADNKIKYLPKDAFWNLTYVKRINLRKNQIEKCLEKDHGIFSRLANLENLLLDDNKIAVFPRDLPPGLQWLSLNSNHIKTIGPSDFAGTKNLKFCH